jgi:hypothetical protein
MTCVAFWKFASEQTVILSERSESKDLHFV